MTLRARDRISAAALATYARWVELSRSQSGASAIEYGLLVSVIVLAIIAAMTALGSSLNVGIFQGFAEFFAGS